MKRVAFYVRVSTLEQNPETQLRELREYAERRGLTVAQEHEYVDHGFGGAKARRPALDRMLEDARRGRFDVLLVWSCDRLARSTKHFLQVLDELDSCNVQFIARSIRHIGSFGSGIPWHHCGLGRDGKSTFDRASSQWHGPRQSRRSSDRTCAAECEPTASD